MKLAANLALVAVLAFSIGIAFASPMIYDKIIVPPTSYFELPKPDFSVKIIYASIRVNESLSNAIGGVHLVDYEAILNVTNLADYPARVASVNFGAAKNITVSLGFVGSPISAFNGGGCSGGGGVADGVYVDGFWINTTWIPGSYPEGLQQVLHLTPYLDSRNGFYANVSTVIPSLPPNASEAGFWLAGVPFSEIHAVYGGGVIQSKIAIYINGAWVDVTGRVAVKNPQPSAVGIDSVAYGERRLGAWYDNEEGGFNNSWAPGESRLILVNGTTAAGWIGLQSIAEGKIDLYASVSTYLKNYEEMSVSGNFKNNTSSTAFELEHIQIQKTGNAYLYGALPNTNQPFLTDQFGMEVFLTPRS
jgi:hypothetical protein